MNDLYESVMAMAMAKPKADDATQWQQAAGSAIQVAALLLIEMMIMSELARLMQCQQRAAQWWRPQEFCEYE